VSLLLILWVAFTFLPRAGSHSADLRTAPPGVQVGSAGSGKKTTDPESAPATTPGDPSRDSREAPPSVNDGDRARQPADAPRENGELPVSLRSDWNRVDNPVADGWATEASAEQAKHLLVELTPALLGEKSLEHLEGGPWVDGRFTTAGLQPSSLATVFRDANLIVERPLAGARTPGAEAANPGAEAAKPGATAGYQGEAGWADAVQLFARTWQPLTDRRIDFKVFRVAREAEGLVTHQYVTVTGRDGDRVLEQHATWKITWATDADPLRPQRMRSLEVVEFEQSTSLGGDRWFADCTPAVLGANPIYAAQLLHGFHHWIDRNQDMRYFAPLGNPGIALGDVNGDGRDDLYLCQEANLPNRLFLQQEDGSAREAAADWQVDFLEGSRSALLVDFDNDGDQDLAVALMGAVVLASNEGSRFQLRAVLETNDDTTSMSAADYDLDGDVDLYVCVDYPNDFFASRRSQPVQGGAANRVYHDANNAGRNSLFRNDIRGQARIAADAEPARDAPKGASWAFVDVTAETGLDENNRRYSWASCWEDYDDDGDQDLYVSNDFGRNNLYENQNGRFVDKAHDAEVEDIASGMSAAWGDANQDGRMDLYVGNMFSSAGGRITYQPEFKAGADEEIRTRLQRFARGNSLFLNRGDRSFADVSVEAGVTVARWAWSSIFVDVNNDGWQDLAVANGYITSEDTGDL
jgi:hypothetical protein